MASLNVLRPSRYLLPFVVAAVLVLVQGYALSMSDFFVKYLLGGLPLVQVDEIKFTQETEHIDADIVFVGDSTTLFDIVPYVVERNTGLKTYNLGVTIDAFAHGEGPLLSHYLQHNRPPKYMVLHIGSWTQVNDYDASRLGSRGGSSVQWEGVWIKLRHGSFRDIAAVFADHPEQLFKFPLHVLRLAGLSLADHLGRRITSVEGMRAKYEEMRAELEASAGFLGLTEANGYRAYAGNCRLKKLEAKPDREYIESFRRRYSTKDTKVLVLMAPLPECDESIESLRQAYSGLVDLLPRAMPSQYFQNLHYSSHTMLPGAIVNSQVAASLIRETGTRGGP